MNFYRLSRLNNLLRHGSLVNIFPISNTRNATNNFAEKNLFFFLAQKYTIVFKWQMNFRSNFWQLTFPSRTFAYSCLAQGSNESITRLGSFVKPYLDPCLAINVCTLSIDDIAVFLMKSYLLRKTFHCLWQTRSNLSAHVSWDQQNLPF